MATRSTWLKSRCNSIGASEHAALLGLGYKSQTPGVIWANKVLGSDEDDEPEPRMVAGNYTEQAILDWLGDTLKDQGRGEVVREQYAIYYDREHAWLSCSPDGLVDLGDSQLCPVEAKSVYFPASLEWDDRGPPLKFQIQLQHQMRVLKASHGILAAFVNGEPTYSICEYNEEFMACSIETTLAPFWRCVETRTPPPIDGLAVTTKAMSRFFRPREGEAAELGERGNQLWNELDSIGEQRKELDRRENLAKQEVLTLLAGAEHGRCQDGRRFVYKAAKRAAYTVQETTFNQLRRLSK